MKALAIVALVFGLASVGSSIYAVVETAPNYKSNKKRAEESSGQTGKLASLDQLVYEDYKKALGREVVGAWVAGLVALVTGGLALKKGAKVPGAIGIVLALAGVGLAFSVMPQPLVL